MGQRILEKFGRYFLLDRLAAGGMAEVFRARPAVAEANGRVVVIKRILPHIASDPEFSKMFRSEIQVCMGFNHPNTVQLHDFGEAAGRHYIAMEYVEGKTFAQLFVKARDKAVEIPIEASLLMVAQAAAGLQYAHTFTNTATGESLKVIHRDISPQNILVSYGGTVKVIDFGIAKAAVESAETTRLGVIKGKASYLSPEQTIGQAIDCRADLFALGIVLWELLAGRKLFSTPEPNSLAVLQMIQDCDRTIRPPSEFNPKIHPALDALVMKALAKEPDARFQSAADFARAIRGILISEAHSGTIVDVPGLLKSLFADEIIRDRRELQEHNNAAQLLLIAEGVEASEGRTVQLMPPAPAPYAGPMPPPFVATQPSAVMSTYPFLNVFAQTSGTSTSMAAAKPGGLRLTKGRVAFGLFYLLTLIGLKLDQKSLFIDHLLDQAASYRLAALEAPDETTLLPEGLIRRLSGTILLRVNVVPGDASAMEVIVNKRLLNPKRPVIRVKLDQPIFVTVKRPAFEAVQEVFVLPAAKYTGHPAHLLTVRMKKLR